MVTYCELESDQENLHLQMTIIGHFNLTQNGAIVTIHILHHNTRGVLVIIIILVIITSC